jgi:hypothetical protein
MFNHMPLQSIRTSNIHGHINQQVGCLKPDPSGRAYRQHLLLDQPSQAPTTSSPGQEAALNRPKTPYTRTHAQTPCESQQQPDPMTQTAKSFVLGLPSLFVFAGNSIIVRVVFACVDIGHSFFPGARELRDLFCRCAPVCENLDLELRQADAKQLEQPRLP